MRIFITSTNVSQNHNRFKHLQIPIYLLIHRHLPNKRVSVINCVCENDLSLCGVVTQYGNIGLVRIGSGNGLLADGIKQHLNQCRLIINKINAT